MAARAMATTHATGEDGRAAAAGGEVGRTGDSSEGGASPGGGDAESGLRSVMGRPECTSASSAAGYAGITFRLPRRASGGRRQVRANADPAPHGADPQPNAEQDRRQAGQ